MNSFQAIKDAELPANISGQVTIEVERERTLFDAENPLIVGFIVHDNGIGLDDRNFDSFNTAFSPRKSQIGGKGLGRFTWLKAFDQALVKSTFRDDDATLHTRDFVFDRSEEHTSELQSLMRISYAVFCLKTKTQNTEHVAR